MPQLPTATVIDTRRDQMFPELSKPEIERLSRFGEKRRYAKGALIAKTGEVSPGFFLLLSGEVAIKQRDSLGREQLIVTHGPGHFMGELAQLSNRPALVDSTALGEVEAVVIPPPRLRDLMVEEAELGERIMRALILRRMGLLETGAGGPIILGRASSADVLRLAAFLRRNGHPYTILCPEDDPDAKALIERAGVAPHEMPLVLCPNGETLRNPSENDLARCLGLVSQLDPNRLYDVAIVGSGPAGLSAAVYAASEGLCVLLLDCRAFGGQAGASARIENYLGFPTGISGMALMARAYNQAQKFGAEMAIPDEVKSLDRQDGIFRIGLANKEVAKARSVIVASGARYKQLSVADMETYDGAHIHYWASPMEAQLCAGQEVVLVGGGNSAGQAAVYLASKVKKVTMLVRGEGLKATMSRYLIDRIKAQPNIELVPYCEITALKGEAGALKSVCWANHKTGETTERPIQHVFLFIGADPNTDWLTHCDVRLDGKGFVCTGQDNRHPLETTHPGIFAIGDVRSASIKRVAAAVGEGAQVISAIHAYLADGGPNAAEKV
ncbi:MAG TPA: FAD-dependent oxidoreductase [Rhizomicrobium sp.]|jgi:thioredoxin reductase (NADPH)|nr:FAD-dependent oxidoreductase [Rhizomicrobium sp.]